MQKQIQYTIHDVSALLGISADAIRLYEKEGLVEPLRNPANGYRYYTFDQIHRIMGIALYRQLGVGLAEIGELLKHQTFPASATNFLILLRRARKKSAGSRRGLKNCVSCSSTSTT